MAKATDLRIRAGVVEEKDGSLRSESVDKLLLLPTAPAHGATHILYECKLCDSRITVPLSVAPPEWEQAAIKAHPECRQ